MTDFVLTRTHLYPGFTLGELKIGIKHICYTCEDTVREQAGVDVHVWKIPGTTAIPEGRYRIERTFSNRFQHTTPQLMDVPGFSGIRVHPGNTAADTEGCILPGLGVTDRGVSQSQLAYAEFLKWLDAIEKNGDEAWMVIVNPEEDGHGL